METFKTSHESRFLDIYGKVLKWSAVIYAEVYIMFTLLQYVIWDLHYRRKFKQLGTILLLAALVYVLLRQRKDRAFLPGILTRIRKEMTFEQILMILFFVWFIFDTAVRTVLDQTRFFRYNDNRLFYTALSALLYFPFATYAGREHAKQIFEKLVHFNMFYYTALCVWSLWKYYRGEFMWLPSGLPLDNYSNDTVAFRMGGNVNIVAACSAIMLGLCMYMLITKQRRAVKIAYTLAAIVHVAVVLLTNARGSYLAILCMTAAAAFLYVLELLADKKMLMKLGAALAAAVCCAGLLVAIRTPLLSVFAERVVGPHTYANEELKAEDQSEAELPAAKKKSAAEPAAGAETGSAVEAEEKTGTDIADLLLKGIRDLEEKSKEAAQSADGAKDSNLQESGARGFTNTTGRTEVWKACIKILTSSPDRLLFGVSPCFIQKFIENETGNYRDIPHAHNGLMQVAVGLGIPGFLIFFAFLIAIVLRCLHIIVKGRGIIFPGAWTLTILIMGMLLIELVEVMLFSYVRFNATIFYVLAGWVVSLSREIGEKSNN